MLGVSERFSGFFSFDGSNDCSFSTVNDFRFSMVDVQWFNMYCPRSAMQFACVCPVILPIFVVNVFFFWTLVCIPPSQEENVRTFLFYFITSGFFGFETDSTPPQRRAFAANTERRCQSIFLDMTTPWIVCRGENASMNFCLNRIGCAERGGATKTCFGVGIP